MRNLIRLINKSGLILLTVLFLSISCSKREPFRFVQMCDTQLGMGGYEHDVKMFEQAVKQINELNPDFVVICGDLVHDAVDSSFADFNRIRKGFTMPCYPASGNHDVGNKPDAKSLAYYRKTIGDDYYSFENKGVSFVVTNTQLWKVDVSEESENHHQWFERTLNDLGKQDVESFVIGHYPIFIKTPEEEEQYFNLPLDKRERILELFKKNKVQAYLSGHKHETLINDVEGIQFVSGETTSKNFDGRPMGFRLWNVSLDSLTHQFVPLKDLSSMVN